MTYASSASMRPSNTVMLNVGSGIAPQRILRRIAYEPPCYTPGALGEQRLNRRENGQR